MTSGGSNLSMFFPEYKSKRLFAIPSNKISFTSNFISTPIIKPLPLISRIILCFSFSLSNPSRNSFPIFAAFSTKPSCIRASIEAIPAAHDTGFPPKVDDCSPLLIHARMSSRTSVAPMGIPPAIPFARHMMSGVVSQC